MLVRNTQQLLLEYQDKIIIHHKKSIMQNLPQAKLTIQVLTNKNCKAIIKLLENANMDVRSIEMKLKTSQSETSQKLAKLRNVGLVNTERLGKHIFYSLDLDRKEYLENLINQF